MTTTTAKATLIPTIKLLEGAYQQINKDFFENALSKPVITIQCGAKERALGWMTQSKVWHDGEDSYHELNVSADYLNRGFYDALHTLLHEMVHIYNVQNGIKDVSRSGTYHNARFKKSAEQFGLVCEKDGKLGYMTSASEETLAYFKKTFGGLDTLFTLSRDAMTKKTTSKSSSTRKYVCPECGLSVRATKEVHVQCMDCDCPLVLDD